MGKKSFIIYQTWAKLILNLDNEKAGTLIKAICMHENGIEVVIEDETIKAVYEMIAEKLEENDKKYADTVQKRREAAARRWDECKSIQVHANECKSMQKHYDTDTVTDTDTDKDNLKRRGEKFTPPSLEEVKAYCQERRNDIDPEAFISFYESKGWMVGKNKMKDWKACIRTWEKRKAPEKNKYTNFEERVIDFDDLEKRFAKN